MRHAKSKLQFNRFTSWRKATLNSLVRSLLIYQSIKTTRTKALAVKPLAESLIHSAKSGTLAAKRRAFSILGDHKLVSLLFSDIAARFSAKSGGYTRIIHFGSRRGDGADLAILELTEIKKKEAKKPKKEKAAKETEAGQKKIEQGEPKHPEAAEQKKTAVAAPPKEKKPTKKFLGGLRGIFKKERDSL